MNAPKPPRKPRVTKPLPPGVLPRPSARNRRAALAEMIRGRNKPPLSLLGMFLRANLYLAVAQGGGR